MTEKCFDEGIIQAYVDGELTPNLSKALVRHVANCDACSLVLTTAEEENSLVFSTLGEELGVFVPTERLREKVFASIREIEELERRGVWEKITGRFVFLEAFNFSSPSMVALCSTILFVGTFAAAMKFYPRLPEFGDVAVSSELVPLKVGDIEKAQPNKQGAGERPDVTVIANSRRRIRRPIRRNRRAVKRQAPVRNTGPAIDGEYNYIQTIATLDESVLEGKGDNLAPGELVAFEKDLAIVNDAISRLKAEVKKNPGNVAAKRILKATYQSKIDLLNSVTEKNELMASMQ